jgi:hypothetical protein
MRYSDQAWEFFQKAKDHYLNTYNPKYLAHYLSIERAFSMVNQEHGDYCRARCEFEEGEKISRLPRFYIINATTVFEFKEKRLPSSDNKDDMELYACLQLEVKGTPPAYKEDIGNYMGYQIYSELGWDSFVQYDRTKKHYYFGRQRSKHEPYLHKSQVVDSKTYADSMLG